MMEKANPPPEIDDLMTQICKRILDLLEIIEDQVIGRNKAENRETIELRAAYTELRKPPWNKHSEKLARLYAAVEMVLGDPEPPKDPTDELRVGGVAELYGDRVQLFGAFSRQCPIDGLNLDQSPHDHSVQEWFDYQNKHSPRRAPIQPGEAYCD